MNFESMKSFTTLLGKNYGFEYLNKHCKNFIYHMTYNSYSANPYKFQTITLWMRKHREDIFVMHYKVLTIVSIIIKVDSD